MLDYTHILIVGRTGSGKSTLIDQLLQSIMLKNPNDRFIIFDNKRVQFLEYKKAKQCLRYYTDSNGLRDCIRLMENRYNEMSKKGLKQYAGNKIYVVIDELFYMFTDTPKAKKDIEKLAMLARATNMYIIAGSQCINTNVIDSSIRCNFAYRVCLPVENKNQSRIVLETSGGENLKIGECLIKEPGNIFYNTIPLYSVQQKNELLRFYKK